MNIIGRKSKDTSANYFYGVNVNDQEAVRQEYNRLRKKHRNITILIIIVLILLSLIIVDFYRVNYYQAKPLFAIQKKVEKGTLFNGIGYKVLYCQSGERYIGSVLYKSCDEFDERTFANIVYEKVIDYSVKNKTLNREEVDQFLINNVIFDEENDEGGADYLADISFTCKDGSDKCFKTAKEYYDPLNIKIYIRLNKYNEVYAMIPFKTSGVYYDSLKEKYSEKIKEYLKANNLLVEDNLRYTNINIMENHGKYKFRNNSYADSYLVEINYMCVDNSNTCITAVGDTDLVGDYANLSFYMSMFLDENDNIVLMGPKEYFEI